VTFTENYPVSCKIILNITVLEQDATCDYDIVNKIIYSFRTVYGTISITPSKMAGTETVLNF
jgi:hypothetical protein